MVCPTDNIDPEAMPAVKVGVMGPAAEIPLAIMPDFDLCRLLLQQKNMTNADKRAMEAPMAAPIIVLELRRLEVSFEFGDRLVGVSFPGPEDE